MCRSSDLARHAGKDDRPSDDFKIALGVELLGDSEQIYRRMLVDKGNHGLINHPVLLAVETGRREFLHCIIDAVGLDKHGSDDSLFYVKSLRWLVAHLKPKRIEVDG